MELILAIAALCSIHTGSVSYSDILLVQQGCQAELAKCVENEGKKLDSNESKLLACMQKRGK